ncbi:hypothetical protein [Mesomycoplasma lagogenitalium]|uniref:DNA polymerase III subunit delta n=1 Tax=Mesomycoplasma lagogenitalium TaxID=171286 RepID=A0ABY8LV45_9BACT|nr:hypothetical protein [Mesomycoplasma lagogenitalium]WGI36316.1 hypothetical protein QEG99_02450 [Mesomycoplasma lagogenitalium]
MESKKIIENVFKNQKFFHSWLLSSYSDEQLFEILFFLCSKAKGHLIDSVEKLKNNAFVIDGTNVQLTKENIELIIKKNSFTNFNENDFKLFIIFDIDKAHINAINALLKTIEEPFSNTLIIMTTKNIKRVIKTIISRSFVINCNNFTKLEKHLNEMLIKNNFDKYQNLIIKLSNYGLEFNEQNFEQYKNNINDFINAIEKEKWFYLNNFLIKNWTYDNNEIFLKLISIFLTEKLFNQNIYLPKKAYSFIMKKTYLTNHKIAKILVAINEFEKKCEYNINFKLQKSALLVKINNIVEEINE